MTYTVYKSYLRRWKAGHQCFVRWNKSTASAWKVWFVFPNVVELELGKTHLGWNAPQQIHFWHALRSGAHSTHSNWATTFDLTCSCTEPCWHSMCKRTFMFIQSNGVGVDVTNAISASKRLSVLGRFVADVEITSIFWRACSETVRNVAENVVTHLNLCYTLMLHHQHLTM